MPSLKGTFAQITSYRLGYTSQHPYPWRWATPAILGVFLLISVFLALVNIPLSAYDIVQESTYRPNDTLPPLLFNQLVPGLLHSPGDTFAPHILTVGENLLVNNSVFNFTIIRAWDNNSAPVSSFSYYNNPFSDGCDITWADMTITIPSDGNTPPSVLVDVICHIPTLFQMTSTLQYYAIAGGTNPLRENLSRLWSNLNLMFFQFASLRWNISGFSASVGTTMSSAAGAASGVSMLWGYYCSSTFIFNNSEGMVPEPEGSRLSLYRFLNQPSINNVFQNVFESLYHLARLELGIIVENQIFNSPTMFNESISAINFPSFPLVAANEARASTSNATLMKEWADTVQFFNTSDRVPLINYLRPVPRVKPLGSALTSVFVSTFAMVSVLWTVFCLIAGVIAARSETASTQRNPLFAVEDRLDTHDIDIAQIKLSFARMELALINQGLIEDDNEEGGLEASITCTSGHDEKSTLLVHRKQSDSYSAV
ncbi:hypothetical protein C8R46DRAFT_1347826, partial [Mycena filopes]